MRRLTGGVYALFPRDLSRLCSARLGMVTSGSVRIDYARYRFGSVLLEPIRYVWIAMVRVSSANSGWFRSILFDLGRIGSD